MQVKNKSFIRTMIFIFALGISTSGVAANQFINYQGMLADAGGSPVNGDVTMIFSIWDDIAQSTNQLWEEEQVATVVNGIFTVQLGRNIPLPPATIFNTPNLYLEIVIDGTALTPRTLLSNTPSAFWSEESGNAMTLAGQTVAYFAPTNHTHSYTEITGNTTYVDTKIIELKTVIVAQQEQIDLLLNALQPEDLELLSTEFTQLSTTIDQLTTRVDQLETSVNARNAIDDLMPFLSVTGTDVVLSGANLTILNGAGSTDTTNGTGNLILGYNALRDNDNNRTGSHNLIIGDLHSYGSYGGFVAGKENSILAPYASITGGAFGSVQSELGAILGGYENTVNGMYGTIVGGVRNIISTDAFAACVLGGMDNQAQGLYSSVAGGVDNQANGSASAILGGDTNIASGETSALLGGYSNVVEGGRSILIGGRHQTVVDGQDIGPIVSPFQEVMKLDGDTLRFIGVNVQIENGMGFTHRTNGKGNLILGYNAEPTPGMIPGSRTGSHNLILGDFHNYDATSGLAIGYYNYLASAGLVVGMANKIAAPPVEFAPFGIATIIGGTTNSATGAYSTVLGGKENTASGIYSAIVGGRDNIASGERSTVAGGDKNEAGGIDTTIGGGLGNRAFLDKSAIPAGRFLSEEGQ